MNRVQQSGITLHSRVDMDMDIDEDLHELSVGPWRQEACALDMGSEDHHYVETESDSAEFTSTADVSPEIPRTIQFRLGTRTVTATGAPVDWFHPNVFRLCIHNSIIQSILGTLYRRLWLPLSLRTWLSSSFPEWFLLSRRVILKRQKKGWDEEFEMELVAYEQLKPLQGVVVPIFYGQAEYRGVRSIVLSDIGGASVATPEGAILPKKDMHRLFDQALRPLAELGLTHDDLKLDNFHLVEKDGEKAIMVVDLERINLIPKESSMVEWDIEKLMDDYRDHLKCLKNDGLLLIKM